MEERKQPLFYLCDALQPGSLCCSALYVLEKNKGGTNKATTVEQNQHLLCQQRAVAPNSVQLTLHHTDTHTHTVWVWKAARKCLEIKTRWSQAETSWGDGGGNKTKTQGEE